MLCKAWEAVQKKAAILASVETARIYGVKKEWILADIMKRFKLDENTAKEYMANKSVR